MTRQPSKTKTEIAVIGGGPAGLAAALALANNGWSVTLVAPAPRALTPGGRLH